MNAKPPATLSEYGSELEAIRREWQELKLSIARRRLAATLQEFAAKVAMAKKYNPNQPRVPAGGPDGGQWTSGSDASSSEFSAARRPTALEATCLAQYTRDTFHCTMVGSRACHQQAALRYANCLARKPIPPLNY